MQRRALQVVLLVIVLLPLPGCGASGVFPITTGSHRVVSSPHNGVYIVWANHIGTQHQITSLALEQGFRVVERTKLEAVFEEQKIHLTSTPSDQANLLKVGRLVGAGRIIFAEVQIPGSFDPPGIKVAIRSVSVETAEVQWSGTAEYLEPVGKRGLAIHALVLVAIDRATCKGRWVEYRNDNEDGGCHQASSRGGEESVHTGWGEGF